jgi:undecaprenyl pyrophosphate phosphatase UppP
MKSKTTRKFLEYMYNNFAGNFLGFVIGMASARLVSHYFTTRSIKNLWGLTARKTVVDKQTFSAMEMAISILIGFIVFEIISKWVKKKMDELLPKYKLTRWLAEEPVAEEASLKVAEEAPLK